MVDVISHLPSRHIDAVHIDVDDVLALAEASAVEGELTSAGWTGQMFFQIFRHVTIVVPRVLHGVV